MSQRNIIITGGSRGFGRSLALKLADEQTRLHLVARSSCHEIQNLAEKAGAEVAVYKFDLTRTDRLDELVERLFRNIEGRDGFTALVNNAGTLDPMGPLGKHGAVAYRENLELNFVAPTMLAHHFIRHTQNWKGTRRIAFVSSGAAHKPYYGWSHYCSTKAGIDMLMRTVAVEQESMDSPIGVMSYNPGRMTTDMQAQIREQSTEDFAAVQDFIDAKKEGRVADVDERADLLAKLLVSDNFPAGEIVKASEWKE